MSRYKNLTPQTKFHLLFRNWMFKYQPKSFNCTFRHALSEGPFLFDAAHVLCSSFFFFSFLLFLYHNVIKHFDLSSFCNFQLNIHVPSEVNIFFNCYVWYLIKNVCIINHVHVQVCLTVIIMLFQCPVILFPLPP